MTRLRILDLFCGAGGAGYGYSLAGFDVVGVDINPQPRYPFEFHQGDALAFLRSELACFDAVHASPPCQFATAYRRRNGVALDAINLIPETRELLEAAGIPYVIENVEQARPYLVDPVLLCGTSFGPDLQRHRLFESNVQLVGSRCDHARNEPEWPQATNRSNPRRTVEVGVYRIPLADQQRVMGAPWMTLSELSQAIPPAYTEFIGKQMINALKEAKCAT